MAQSVKSKDVFIKIIVLDQKFVGCALRQKGLGLEEQSTNKSYGKRLRAKMCRDDSQPGSLSTESHLEILASFG
jgi:hypothetical protein